MTAEPVIGIADYSDQIDIFNPTKVGETVTVIGCGGIGASILPTLLTMGFTRFIIFDDDLVEPRNITTNLIYRPSDIYRPKVERTEEYLREYGATSVEAHREKYDGQIPLTGLVISGVDSMAARKAIWEHVATSDITLYMDGRIGGQHMTLLTLEPFNPAHVEWYEEYCLFDDARASKAPCTARTVVYPAVVLGGYMARGLAAWSRGEAFPNRIDINFKGDLFFRTVTVPTD